MSKAPSDNQYFGTEKTMKILFKLAPPVMLAQLIQSLYNIVDSFFIGKFSGYALTALSVIYPMQLLICAALQSEQVSASIPLWHGFTVKSELPKRLTPPE